MFAFTSSCGSALTFQKPNSFSGTSLYQSGDGSNERNEPRQSKRKRDLIPFFGRFTKSKAGDNESDVLGDKNKSLPTKLQAESVAYETEPQDTRSNDAYATATSLREQAERARLEAERMDAELTLAKIEKLERKLVQAKVKGEAVDDFQRQLDNLQAKLRGEAPKPRVPATASLPVPKVPDVRLDLDATPVKPEVFSGTLSTMDGMFGKDFDETVTLVDASPSFVKKLVATLVEYDFDSIDDVNSTEIARRISMMNSGDYSYSELPKPAFTQSQIDDAVGKVEKQTSDQSYPRQFIKLAGGNVTKLAMYSLEYDYYISSRIESNKDALDLILKAGEGEEWMQPLLDAINQTAVDRSIETLYPKCMRTEGIAEPTMDQVQSLVSTVLPRAKFSSTAKPEKVLGGYVIRGNHKYEMPNQLIAAIDSELSKAQLADKMTVLYSSDFTIFAQAEEEGFDLDLFDADEQPPILYVTAPDIAGDRQRVLLSVTSALGLATSWYLSLYPFLLNPAISKRVEDQLALADASMAYNLDWLTELSVPLFASFLGIQLTHELAHRAVAAIYGVSLFIM